MRPNYTKLTEQKINSQWFVVPSAFLVLAYGKDFYKDYLQKQKAAELKGHELEVIGWPNGTTALWERPDPTKKINVEKLVAAYYAFHNFIDLYYAKAGSC